MTIDFTKPVQTRDGQPVTILTTERANSPYPVVGLVRDSIIQSFTSEGKFCSNGREHAMDLVNVPDKHVRKIWLNVYPGNTDILAHKTKDKANECASANRIACIPVTIEFEERDGL